MATKKDNWSFPAAGVQVLGIDATGHITVKVVLDLGFGIYKTLKANIRGAFANNNKDHVEICGNFIQQWCAARADQQVLEGQTFRILASNDWIVHLYQTDNDQTIAEALEEQGIGHGPN